MTDFMTVNAISVLALLAGSSETILVVIESLLPRAKMDYARPYEKEAKQTASDILGYTPEGYEIYLIREEPEGVLYDRPIG